MPACLQGVESRRTIRKPQSLVVTLDKNVGETTVQVLVRLDIKIAPSWFGSFSVQLAIVSHLACTTTAHRSLEPHVLI